MEYIPFTFKRTHHVTLSMLRPIAAKHHLTPARFDLLYALHLLHEFPVQSRLSAVLHVTRATICKMVRGLKKAGFLRAKVHIWDRRYRRLKLTPYGKRCFHKILKLVRHRIIHRNVLDLANLRTPQRAARNDFFRELMMNLRAATNTRRTYENANVYRNPFYERAAGSRR